MTSSRRGVHWALALSTAWAIGCSGAHTGTGSGPVPFDTPSAFCRAYELHYAQAQFTCAGAQGAPPDDTTDDCAVLDDALAQGEITFDPSGAAACLTALDAGLNGACSTDPPCVARVIKGRLAAGEACTHWMECPAGGGCGVGNEFNFCVQQVCTDGSALMGQPCNSASGPECAFGLECRSAAGTPAGTCGLPPSGAPCHDAFTDCQFYAEYCAIDGTCHARVPIGASCVDDAKSCVSLATCDPTTRLCVPAGAQGQACGAYSECWRGVCFGDPGAVGVCKPALADGAPCMDRLTCASGICTNGTCAKCP